VENVYHDRLLVIKLLKIIENTYGEYTDVGLVLQ